MAGQRVLTREQEDLLLHMTGLDRAEEPYRNHFASEGEADGADWLGMMALVEAGLSRPPTKPRPAWGGLRFFYATDEGVLAARRIRASRTSGTPGGGSRRHQR